MKNELFSITSKRFEKADNCYEGCQIFTNFFVTEEVNGWAIWKEWSDRKDTDICGIDLVRFERTSRNKAIIDCFVCCEKHEKELNGKKQ